jgi:hypothetical protein
MNITYRSLASTLLLIAYGISAAFQIYRASLGTGLDVDQFRVPTAVAYAVFLGLAVAVRLDRTWIWWLTGVVVTANLVFGVFVYYPMVHAARPMDLFDWAEGTLFTGLLLAALGCTVLRLTGTTLSRAPERAPGPDAEPRSSTSPFLLAG